jgi:hypothetical protein
MTTADLIDRLARDLVPVRRNAVPRRLAIGIGAGVAISAIVMLLWLGPRPDLGAAVGTAPFWMKFAYTLAASIAAFAAGERLVRPAADARGATIAGLAIVAAIATVAILQLAGAAPASWPALVLGGSASLCPWRIVVLALPVLVGAFWAMRGLAPTRLRLAGLSAGLVAGACGAFVYAFFCTETAAPFVAIWYTMGILATGLVGMLLGRPLLRW